LQGKVITTMPTAAPKFPASKQLGRWIRRRRQSLDLDQAELGALVGLSVSSISRLESGRRHIFPRDVEAFSLALRVPRDWFADPGPLPLPESEAPVVPTGSGGDGDHLADEVRALRQAVDQQTAVIHALQRALVAVTREYLPPGVDEADPLSELGAPADDEGPGRSAQAG
jgi:transcriptional regulator with XRE-family HTH domain